MWKGVYDLWRVRRNTGREVEKNTECVGELFGKEEIKYLLVLRR